MATFSAYSARPATAALRGSLTADISVWPSIEGTPRAEFNIARGVCIGMLRGRDIGLAIGLARGGQAGAVCGYDLGLTDGRRVGIATGLATAPVVTPDDEPPIITFISPTPGVAPGAVGGFPKDPAAAKVFPIVIQIGDTDPGLQYVCVGIRYTNEDGDEIEETVYRRNNFRGRYVTGSSATMVGEDLQLTILREGGWLELVQGATRQFAFFADVVDAAGNVSEEE